MKKYAYLIIVFNRDEYNPNINNNLFIFMW